MAPQSIVVKELVDLEVPQDARLSPSGARVIWSAKPPGKKGEHEVSTLWMANVLEERSARRMTIGFNDRLPQWSPTAEIIAFISDRHKPGESCAIYTLEGHPRGPIPLTDPKNKKPISDFQWSPNGKFIAYLSPDEDSFGKEDRMKSKDDARVYGSDWDYNRLRLVNFITRQAAVIFSRDVHVEMLSWTDTSEQILITTHQTPDINSSTYHGVNFELVTPIDRSVKHISHFPGRIHSLQWTKYAIYIVAAVKPKFWSSARAVYQLAHTHKNWIRYTCGDANDAIHVISKGDILATHVLSKYQDVIRLPPSSVLHKDNVEILPNSWDVARSSAGDYVLAYVGSDTFTPPEVIVMIVPGVLPKDQHKTLSGENSVYPLGCTESQMSNYGETVSPLGSPLVSYTSKILTGYSAGDVEIEAIYHSPTGFDPTKPQPTVVLIHGGPFDRWASRFGCQFPLWAPALLALGTYSVLVPNYRGSSSYGESFAALSRGTMGTVEYDDIVSLVDFCIRDGFVDKDKIVVAGWGHGGFLSYICAVRNGFDLDGQCKPWSFKAAIAGAGVTDWDSMIMGGDTPCFTSELAGGAPWKSTDKSDTSCRQGSAIWELANAKGKIPPMLILHGEQDERVPVAQAIAFHRGCVHHGYPCELVLYPREPHVFKERQHIVDMLNRVLDFCALHLLSQDS